MSERTGVRPREGGTSPRRELRALLESPEPCIVPEAYSALTARIVEHVGFRAAYVGGHPIGQMHYAIPNCGVLTSAEAIDQAARIADVVTIPIIVDADSLGETVADAHRAVRRYEQVGVSAIHVEDQVNPNHSTYANGLLSVSEMQAKLDAAVRARCDDDFVVIARCDAMFPNAGGDPSLSQDEALEQAIVRGRAYAQVGADAFLVAPTHESATIERLAAEVPLPIINYGNPTAGAALSICSGWGVPMAARVHLEMARTIFEAGGLDESMEFSLTWDAPFKKNVAYPHKAELIGQDEYDAVIARWVEMTGRRLRT